MMRKIRVLVVAPGRGAKGGISSAVSAISDSREIDHIETFWVESMDDRNGFRKTLSFFTAYLNYLLRLAFFDLVHVHVSSGTSFYRKSLFIALALIFRRPYILHIHPSHFIDFFENSNRFGKWVISRISKSAAVVIALSEGAAVELKRKVGVHEVAVLPNPCPYPVVLNFTSEQKSNEVLFAGKIMQAKGCFELLNAFSLVTKQVPGSRLVMAGNGEVERFKKYAENIGLSDCVIFTGWIDGERLLAAYRNASILCLPSHSEGLPVSILQAMSQGVAVVATPVGGIPEIIKSGQNGILVPVGNETALAEAIVTLLKDNEKRLAIGKNAVHAILNGFSTDVVVKRLLLIYESILQDRA